MWRCYSFSQDYNIHVVSIIQGDISVDAIVSLKDYCIPGP